MNTQHLRYAIEVEQTGSITQAAENLYVGQPSVSKAIKELEEILGIVIFKRTSKGAVPTEKGAEFLKYARAVMKQIEKMELLQKPNYPDRQTVSVSYVSSGYIGMAVAEFAADLNTDKEMDVRLWETDAMQVIDQVDSRKASMGIIRYNTRYETYFLDYLQECNLKHELVWEFESTAVFSKKHPLAECTSLSPDALFPYVEVKMGGEEVPYILVRNEKRPDERADKQIWVCDRTVQYELLSRIPGAYAWEAPLPEDILERYGLMQRGCALENMRFRDEVIYWQEHEFTSVEKRFINKLYDHRNRLAFQNVHKI